MLLPFVMVLYTYSDSCSSAVEAHLALYVQGWLHKPSQLSSDPVHLDYEKEVAPMMFYVPRDASYPVICLYQDWPSLCTGQDGCLVRQDQRQGQALPRKCQGRRNQG